MTATRRSVLALAATSLALSVAPARAQARTVRIAKQFGIGYLPLTIMEEKQLLEEHARKLGLEAKTEWVQFTGGTPMNEALISGNLDFASGGVGPLLTIWARTRANLGVKGVASLNSMPLFLNTINPNVKTLKDFTDKGKIALPAVRTSIQAVTLQMAAEKEFGPGNHGRLDPLTVSMSHPDATAAMLSGRSEITAHFTSAPFQYTQLEDSRVRKVLDSYEVMGGPHTFNSVWAMDKLYRDEPKVVQAFLAALEQSMQMIAADPAGMAALWVKAEKSRVTPEATEKLIRASENEWTMVPKNIMGYAEFMSRVGLIPAKPASWQDVFFPDIHRHPGS